MRRSIWGGSGGMGGGSGGGRGGGGGLLRSVQRAVRTSRVGGGAAAQEPFSHSSTSSTGNNSTTARSSSTYKPTSSNALSVSSNSNNTTPSPFSSFSSPISATSIGPNWGSCASSVCSDEFEWEYIDGNYENDRSHEFYEDHFVFGSVPSVDEVQHAVSSLQQVLDPASFSQFINDRGDYNSDKDLADQITGPTGFIQRVPSVGSEVDWMEPSLQLSNSRMLNPCGSDRVYDAFHLLQTEPSVQKMVISLSSDKAVWDAVLNNEVVRELRESLKEADKNIDTSSDEGSDDDDSRAATNILSWIFVNTKAMVMELIDKITKLVDEIFQPPVTENAADPFEEKLRTSLLLSVVVFLIVVVSRAHRGSS